MARQRRVWRHVERAGRPRSAEARDADIAEGLCIEGDDVAGIVAAGGDPSDLTALLAMVSRVLELPRVRQRLRELGDAGCERVCASVPQLEVVSLVLEPAKVLAIAARGSRP